MQKLRKTSKHDKTIKNNLGTIYKVALMNGFVNVGYQNCVNNQLEREGKDTDFTAVESKWGERVNESKTLHQHVNKDGEHKKKSCPEQSSPFQNNPSPPGGHL